MFFFRIFSSVYRGLRGQTAQNRNVEHSNVVGIAYLCGMNFTSQIRYNPQTCKDEKYYRLKESYRDASGRVCTLILLNVGFIHDLSPEQIRDVARGLTYLYNHQKDVQLWDEKLQGYSEVVRDRVHAYWARLVEEEKLDIVGNAYERSKSKARKRIDVDTMRHTDAREVGCEWLCLQTIRKLGLDKFLRSLGWSEDKVKVTLAHLITRAAYTPSELKSISIIKENSAVCELLDLPMAKITPRRIYRVADDLYSIKDKLEKYLCHKTDDLFKPTNRIMLFDLTNFYFEGRKTGSKKAAFGRSKEKRSDCKLLVLALCINTDGFIRYSAVLEGNTADPKSLPNMVDELIAENPAKCPDNEGVLVVIDAGISTEDNLKTIRDKGYNYLCVSRKALTEYTTPENAPKVTVCDCLKREITLQRVTTAKNDDCYLKIDSPAKALKEESMNRKFRERFEEGLKKIRKSTQSKHGIKNYGKVQNRIGALQGKYPSISRYYNIKVEDDGHDKVASMTWEVNIPDKVEYGTYFLRTNVKKLDEETTWNYYNLIREIECSNRQLKTDLSLRPIYHQTDNRADAHLFLGLLAYWIVNTVRHQMKVARRKQGKDEHGRERSTPYWSEIMRIMKTQKAVTTTAVNALGEAVETRLCSVPTDSAAEIYELLKISKVPFKKIKICRTQ